MQVLDLRALESKIHFKETRIRQLVREGKFPQPVKLAGLKLCWLESEVDQWLAERFAQRGVTETGKG